MAPLDGTFLRRVGSEIVTFSFGIVSLFGTSNGKPREDHRLIFWVQVINPRYGGIIDTDEELCPELELFEITNLGRVLDRCGFISGMSFPYDPSQSSTGQPIN